MSIEQSMDKVLARRDEVEIAACRCRFDVA